VVAEQAGERASRAEAGGPGAAPERRVGRSSPPHSSYPCLLLLVTSCHLAWPLQEGGLKCHARWAGRAGSAGRSTAVPRVGCGRYCCWVSAAAHPLRGSTIQLIF